MQRGKLITVVLEKPWPEIHAEAQRAYRRALRDGADPLTGVIEVLDENVTLGGPLGALLDAVDAPVVQLFAELLLVHGGLQ